MLAPMRYLEWAVRYYGQAPWDLATSGIAPLSARELFALGPEEMPMPDDAAQIPRFRALVAARYGVSEGEVCPALGASGGLYTAYAALLSPGDDVLVEHPAYEPLHAVAAGLGARIRTFERPASAGFELDVQAVLS